MKCERIVTLQFNLRFSICIHANAFYWPMFLTWSGLNMCNIPCQRRKAARNIPFQFFRPKYYNTYTNSMPLNTCHKDEIHQMKPSISSRYFDDKWHFNIHNQTPHYIQIRNDTCLYAYYAHIEFNFT